MKSADLQAAFPNEAALCACFIDTLQSIDGWTAYPETAGFDILAVYKTGHQLGIEAKLKLNAKVADQIMPDEHAAHYGAGEPDFRAVIVPGLTDSSFGIAKLLRAFGVMVWAPSRDYVRRDNTTAWTFGQALGADRHLSAAAYDEEVRKLELERWKALMFSTLAWHDWNPAKRCALPEIVPHVPAGVPSPVQLTSWKIGALKVLADLEVDGFVTAKSVRAHGVDPRRFCAADGWLAPLGEGKWGRGKIPSFDQQHPEAYAQVLTAARSRREETTA